MCETRRQSAAVHCHVHVTIKVTLGNKKGDPIWVALAIGRYALLVSAQPPSEGLVVLGRTARHARVRESGGDGGEV